ncbi:MAG: transposase [Verrucomicrobiales bacterium]
MRRPRLLAPTEFSYAVYHCVSRVVDRGKVLGDKEKEQFTKYMRLYSKLYGLRILTHCLMSNHFHILVEVPPRPEVLLTNQELIDLIRATLGDARADKLASWFAHCAKHGNDAAIKEERERWFSRMWNLASFMKVLKQRFSQWFNGTRATRRTGTLWEDRYRSVLVERGTALQAMAAYIDLNPVRAGLVSDPKDFRWSGYGEAMAGREEATAGLRWLAEHPSADGLAPAATPDSSSATVLAWYREQLYFKGQEIRDQDGTVVKRGFSEEEIKAVIEAGGRLPLTAFLRLRVRYFTDGAVLGSNAFVEKVFQAHRERFSDKRLTGARRLQRLELESPLRVARALAVRAVE